MAKELEILIKVDGQEIDVAKKSTKELTDQIGQLKDKLSNVPMGSADFKKIQGDIDNLEKGFTKAKQATQPFIESMSQLPGALGFVGQSMKGVKEGLDLLAENPLIAVFTLLAEVVIKVGEKMKEMESVMEPLNAISNTFGQIFQKLAQTILPPVVYILDKVAKGVEIAGNFMGKLFGSTNDLGTATAYLTKQNAELELSTGKFNMEQAKANRQLQEAREKAQDLNNTIPERIKALKEAEEVEKDIMSKREARALLQARLQAMQIAIDADLDSKRILSLKTANQKELEAFAEQAMEFKTKNKEKIGALYQYLGTVDEIGAEEARIGTKTQKQINALNKQQIADNKTKNKEINDQNLKDADAAIKVEIEKGNTSLVELQKLYDKRNAIEDRNLKLTENQKKERTAKQKKEAEEAIKADQTTRDKSFDDFLKEINDHDKREIEQASIKYDQYKRIYGKDSEEARNALHDKQKLELDSLETEKQSLEDRAMFGDGLSKAEIKRLEELNVAIDKQKEIILNTNQQETDSDTQKVNKMIDNKIKLYQDLEKNRIADAATMTAAQDEIERLQNEKYEKDLKAAGDNADAIAAINKQKTDDDKANSAIRINIAEKEAQAKTNVELAYAKAVGEIGNIIASLAGKNKTLQDLALILQKGAAIAEVVINARAANAKATFEAMPLLLNPITAGPAAAALAAVQASIETTEVLSIAAIAATTIGSLMSGGSGGSSSASSGGTPKEGPKAYADGGMIEGPSHAYGGININAQGGEAVMTRGAVTMFGPMLSKMNQMGGGTSFTKGAIGQPYTDNATSNTKPQDQPVFKTYVVSHELTTEAQKQARLKDLSTL